MLYLRKRERKAPMLFILPSLFIVAGIFLYPVIKVLSDSFFLINGADRKFIGLQNYRQIFTDKLFWTAVTNNLKLFLCVPVLVVLSLLFAVALFQRIPGWKVYRILLLIPYILSVSVVGIVFDYLLREDGLFNQILQKAGLGGLSQPWLGQTDTALYAIMVVVVWKELGFGIVLLLARLLSIDESVLEAARLDGAGILKITRYILLPELKSVLSFYIILSMINMLSWMFNYVFVMTRGGPQNSTYIMEYYIYQMGIRYRQYGLSSALAIFLLLFAMVLVFLQQQVRKCLEEEY